MKEEEDYVGKRFKENWGEGERREINRGRRIKQVFSQMQNVNVYIHTCASIQHESRVEILRERRSQWEEEERKMAGQR